MNVTLESAPNCRISADGSHITLGDWTNLPDSTTADSRKNIAAVQTSKSTLASSNAMINTGIGSSMSAGANQSVKTNLSPEEVFVNSIRNSSSSF